MWSKRELAARMVDAAGAAFTGHRFAPWRGLLVLCYHRIAVGEQAVVDRGVWTATPEAFDRQVAHLKRAYDVIGPESIAEALARRRGRHVLITFDDGYRDNYELAFPILASHGVPALFFLATGFLDTPALLWWDELALRVRSAPTTCLDPGDWLDAPLRLTDADREPLIAQLARQVKRLSEPDAAGLLEHLRTALPLPATPPPAAARPMTWPMVREMAAGGMAFGGHTVNHRCLGHLSEDEQRHEIAGCRRRLEHELGRPMRWFSYPYGRGGAFNDTTRRLLAEEGVEYAFSFAGGWQPFHGVDRHDVPRIGVEHDMSAARFRAQAVLPRLYG